ncbi:MAG: translocation/assembly module TamB domain-containing protein [Saprospiraceae bacterium]|nr:translocation/assembly module TamB domain-containing protein [Saprospiraceae bacterium]
MIKGKISKLILRIVLALFVIFLLVYLLIQLPPVQTFIIDKITTSLSRSLGAPIDIDRVRLKFFKTAALEKFYVGDQDQDTLLFADEIDVNLSLFSFLRKEIAIDELRFSNTRVNLKRKQGSSDFNYQFIIDYFSSGDTTSEGGWNIDLRKVRIYNSEFQLSDQVAGQDIHMDIGIFSTYLNKLDLEKHLLDIEQIGLGDSYLTVFTSPSPTSESEDSSMLSFPNTGWTIKVKQIRLDENDLAYQVAGVEKQEYLNFNDLDIKNLSLFIDDFNWMEDSIGARLTQTTFEDHSGFDLHQMTADLSASPTQIKVENLHLKTAESHLNNHTRLELRSFDQLREFSDSVLLETNFKDTEIDIADLKLLIPDFEAIPYLNPQLEEKIKIEGAVRGYLNNLKLSNLKVRSNGLVSIDLDGKIQKITQPDQLSYEVNLHQFNTSYRSIKRMTRNIKISPGLADWNDFKIKGRFKGNLETLKGTDVRLQTSSITQYLGDFSIRGLQDFTKAHFDVHFDDLRTVAADLKGFSEKKLPAALDSLGQFYYQGDFNGTIYDFDLVGKLASDAGSMQTDIHMDFDKDYKDARYSGDIALDSFNLGKVLAIDELGYLSMAINVFGNGLDPDVLRATVLGSVDDLVYNDFHYHDLVIDGRFDKRQFAGHASIDDPNIAFNFEGVVNLNDSLSRYRFRAMVDTINLNALGFVSSKFGFSGNIQSDFTGTFPDNIKGNIIGRELEFSNLSERYHMDSLMINSDFTNRLQRNLDIQSDILQAEMNGNFSIGELGLFLKDYVNQYFPLKNIDMPADSVLLISKDSISDELVRQDFVFDINMHSPDRLIRLLIPEFEKIDTVKLSGEIRSQENYLQIQGYANQIQYNGMSFGPITLSTNGDTQSVENVLNVSNAHFADGVEFPYLSFDMSMENDSAYLGLIMEDATDTIQEKLNLAALVSSEDGRYKIRLNDLMVLNGEEWTVNPTHEIALRGNKININNLDFRKDNQLLRVSTPSAQSGEDFLSAFKFEFENFQLDEVSKLLEVEDAFYEGDVNGSFTLRNAKDKVNYLADLTLNDLALRGERIGNLVIKSEQRTSDLLDVLIQLDGGISGLDIRGTYNRRSSALNIQGEIDQLAVRDLDPFLQKYITDSEGKLSGLIQIGGTSSVPVIDGNFELENVSTFIQYLQARYSFVNEDISINQNKITFRDFTIQDQNKNEAKINGVADFKTISDPTLNLNFTTSRFLVLNTPPNSKDFFYGKLYVKADVDVSGSASRPILQVNATSLDSTDFVLQPLVSESEIQQEEFIIFANPENYRVDTNISIQDLYQVNEYNFEISANIETTPNAQLTIVIDPATGDRLVCRGNGSLAIDIAPNGDPKILGSYIISSGQYAFNFQRVLKRTFEIEPGSRVDFVGDVFKSKFDIVASYGVRTSTYELIKNQSSLNAAEESRSRQRSDVEVKLNLTGTLQQPVAEFDIAVNEQSGGSQTSTVSSKLAQLREDESQMNKQVFGLLIFNSFIAEEQSTNASLLSDASQSVLLSSVSNLLSNELNRLARKYIKGVDLDFGVDSYSANIEEGSGLITELQVGLSKRLLNDRLTIKLGGNVQFENNDNVNLVNNQNSTFSGDFILEYKLTPEGNYNIKFFQVLSNEENIFNPGVNYSETGVSLFFTKSFNSKKYQLQLDE